MSYLLAYVLLAVAAADGDAAERVRSGVAALQAGELDQARTDLRQALDATADGDGRSRIAYDLGLVAAAAEDWAGAAEHLRDAALAEDRVLAAHARSRLGQLRIEEALALMGEDAHAAVREPVAELLSQAVADYRRADLLNPADDTAAANVEVVRLWRGQLADQWRDADRQTRGRDELFVMLDRLSRFQTDTAADLRIAAEAAGTPVERNDLVRLGRSQDDRRAELAALRTKVAAHLQAARTPPGEALQAQPAEEAAAVAGMEPLFEEIAAAVEETAAGARGAAAAVSMAEPAGAAAERAAAAAAGLDELVVTLAALPSLVDRAIARQQALGEESSPPQPPRMQARADRQRRLARWAEEIGKRSRQRSEEPADAPEGAEGYTPPWDRIVELSGQAQQAADQAADRLSPPGSDASASQAEALRLFREIRRLLQPPDQRPQDQPQENQDQKNGDQKDQGEQDPQDQNSQGQPQDRKSQQGQQPQDQQSQDGRPENQQTQEGREGEQPQPESATPEEDGKPEQPTDADGDEPKPGEAKPADLTRTMAEAVLQKALQREREYRRFMQRVRARQRSAVRPEKDW